MSETSPAICDGCLPARALLEGVNLELVAVEAHKMMLTSERQRQSWRNFYNNRPAGRPTIAGLPRRYQNADEFADAMVSAVVVGCNIQAARVRHVERRTRDVMTICPRLLDQMVDIEPEAPAAAGMECASSPQITALKAEFDDMCR